MCVFGLERFNEKFSIFHNSNKKKKKNQKIKKTPKVNISVSYGGLFQSAECKFFFYKLSQKAMSLYDDTILEILFVIINTCLQLTYNIPDTTYLCRHETLIMLPCAIIMLTTRGNMLTYKLYRYVT